MVASAPLYLFKEKLPPVPGAVPVLCQECGEEPPHMKRVKASRGRIHRKACWGCASCEDFVNEPSVMNDIMSTRGGVQPWLIVGVMVLLLLTSSSAASNGDTPALLPFPLQDATFFILRAFCKIFGLLVPLLLFNAVTAKTTFKSRPPSPAILDEIECTSFYYASLLAKAIKFKTISYEAYTSDETTDYNELKKLHEFLEKSFPLAKSRLEWTYINTHSIVIKWKVRACDLQTSFL